MINASFDEKIEGRVTRLLTIAATKYSKTINWIDEPCKTKGDAYWIDDKKMGINDQFCTRIGFLSGVVDGARGEAFQTWARNVLTADVKYSPEMPFVSVVRYTSYDYLMMQVAFNPEVYGIAKSKRSERQFNDWNLKTLAQSPDRLKFYDALKNWAPTYAQAVSRAFEGDSNLKPQDFREPPLVQNK